MVGPPFNFIVEWRLFIAALGGIVGATEIIVIAVVVLFMSGFAALVAYSNKPEKTNSDQVTKKK
jgi:hypothetical protein